MQDDLHINSVSGSIVGPLVDTVSRKVDSKRRITVRASWRDAMGGPKYVYLAPGEAVWEGKKVPCIEIIPVPVLNAKNLSILGLQEDDPYREEVEGYCRFIAQVGFDPDGRIRIPEKYLKYAKISDGVLLSGACDRIKVWAFDGAEEEEEIDFEDFKRRRSAVNRGSAES